MFRTPAHKFVRAPLVLVSDNPNPQPARRELTPYLATGIAEGFEDALDRDEEVAAWQYLHDTGLAYQLQGWFGRQAQAQALIEAGVIIGSK